MAQRTLPGLGLTGYWDLGYDGWKNEMDANLRLLSALVHSKVLDRVAAEPGSPANGDMYLLTGTANVDKIAIRDNGTWVYIPPFEGLQIWVADEDVPYRYDGAAWNADGGGYSDEAALDAVGAAIAAGTQAGITVTYDDATNSFSFAVDPFSSDYQESVRVATIIGEGNITLSGEYTLQGVALVAGDRVLPTDQTAPEDNRVWIVAVGAWTIADDWDVGGPITSGTLVPVDDGDNAGKTFQLLTVNPITLGTTPLEWDNDSAAASANYVNLTKNSAAYTIQATDNRKWLSLTRNGAQTVTFEDYTTIPLKVGSGLVVHHNGASGTKTLQFDATNSINGVTGGSLTLTTRGDAYLIQRRSKTLWSAAPMKDSAAGTYTDENAMDAIAAMFAAGAHTGIQFTYGDGGDELSASLITEYVQDLIAAMFTGGSHSGVSINYNDAGGFIDLTASGSYSAENAMDDIAAMLAAGTHSGITFTYGDGGNEMSVVVKATESIIIAASDELTAITTGAGKVTFRMPYAFTLTEVRASATTAPTGAHLIIDINEAGASILSTKLRIDTTTKSSVASSAPAVISDTSLADDAEITIDFDQVGSTIAGTGVKVYLIGRRT